MVPHNKNIAECSIHEIVDCLSTQPYGGDAKRLIELTESMPKTYGYDWLRISCVPFLFHAFEKMIASDDEPINLFTSQIKELYFQLENITSNSKFLQLYEKASGTHEWEEEVSDVAQKTGEHYGNLFKDFTMRQFIEAKNLLGITFEKE